MNCSAIAVSAWSIHEWACFTIKQSHCRYLENCFWQRNHFYPLSVSVDGLLGMESGDTLKCTSSRLTSKWKYPYSRMCSYVKSRVVITLGPSNPPLHLVFPGTINQDQRSATTMVVWCRTPLLSVRKTGKGENSKTSIFNTPSRNRKNMDTLRLNSENKNDTWIIIYGAYNIQDYYQHTQGF